MLKKREVSHGGAVSRPHHRGVRVRRRHRLLYEEVRPRLLYKEVRSPGRTPDDQCQLGTHSGVLSADKA
ncbi:MAG: hypothetical protein ACI30J_08345 [Paludibacteraceae bacterium]